MAKRQRSPYRVGATRRAVSDATKHALRHHDRTFDHVHEEPRRPSCPDARTGYRARREAFAPAQPGTYRPAPVPMSGTQQAASHVHHAGSRASDVAPRQFYVTTRGSCLHLQSRASYRWRQFWKAPRDLCLQPFSIYPAWADEDQIQASSRQGLWKTTVPKPSARPRGEQKTAHPPCKSCRFRGHTRRPRRRQVSWSWRLHVTGGCTWLEIVNDGRHADGGYARQPHG